MEVNNIIDWNSLTPTEQVQRTIQANNSWSAAQAQKQMDFQREMSNTAHQREIEDLKAAGLNPVLSAKLGGASTPSGAMAQGDTSGTAALVDLLTLSMETANSAANAAAMSAGNPGSASGASILGLNPLDFVFKNPKNAAQMAWNGFMQYLSNTGVNVSTEMIMQFAGKYGIDLSKSADSNSAKDDGKPKPPSIFEKDYKTKYAQYLEDLKAWRASGVNFASGSAQR